MIIYEMCCVEQPLVFCSFFALKWILPDLKIDFFFWPMLITYGRCSYHVFSADIPSLPLGTVSHVSSFSCYPSQFPEVLQNWPKHCPSTIKPQVSPALYLGWPQIGSMHVEADHGPSWAVGKEQMLHLFSLEIGCQEFSQTAADVPLASTLGLSAEKY